MPGTQYTSEAEQLSRLLAVLLADSNLNRLQIEKYKKKFTKQNGGVFSQSEILAGYKHFLIDNDELVASKSMFSLLLKKPTRTMSGVAPITVLTKPFPCPGKCIFCPNDVRMPKSYLADEPGAQRAERNYFDPYLQTYSRLTALKTIGHDVSKAELIILGGTWSFYPEQYQIWFIKECFRALNEFSVGTDTSSAVLEQYKNLESKLRTALSSDPKKNKLEFKKFEIDGADLKKSYNKTVSELYVAPEKIGGFDVYQTASWEELEREQKLNETAEIRNVGLVIETRPDSISEEEVIRVRRLGCTKTQIGVQSLQDSVLKKNNRGHDVAATRRAFRLLRSAGFKIHAHWMANLYGSSVEQDIEDFDQLFSDPDFCPDELKVYPCSLVSSAELSKYHKQGLWKPYSDSELLSVVAHALTHTPEYSRLTRVIRDIPSQDIVVGNKKTNFREIATRSVEEKSLIQSDIRAREIRENSVKREEVVLKTLCYKTSVGIEVFMQHVTKENKIAAFLRLSLPEDPSFITELGSSAVIRELHVYGQLVSMGEKNTGKSQHIGLGSELLEEAKKVATEHGYKNLAVISAIGTKEYYKKRHFRNGKLYQHCKL
ncbi:MAG: tRNA uridine(34) 5-carboxymethylaminomethyl modification radical SAM/GNAT enzyme Elp3 [bacterium]|nr:tRNA uridine(34) 5-carboxymethylaminomethyl modification radical SAM/GNAT enzyme Elp3 [bacterium]